MGGPGEHGVVKAGEERSEEEECCDASSRQE